jgi:hypothetical protein
MNDSVRNFQGKGLPFDFSRVNYKMLFREIKLTYFAKFPIFKGFQIGRHTGR